MGCPGAQLQMVAATFDGVSRSGDGMFKAQFDTSGRVSSLSRGLQQREAEIRQEEPIKVQRDTSGSVIIQQLWQADAVSKSTMRPSCSATAHHWGCRHWSCTKVARELPTCGQRQQHGRSHLLDSKFPFAGCAFRNLCMHQASDTSCWHQQGCSSMFHATCWSLPRQALRQQAPGWMAVYVLNSLVCKAPGKVTVHGSVGQFTADHAQDLALHGVCVAAPSPVDLTAGAPQLQPRLSPVTDLSPPVNSSRLDVGR